MIRLRKGTVVAVGDSRPGAVELSVDVDGEGQAAAVAYPDLVGPVRPGDRVLLNTTAVALGLGTGGVHFVVAVDGVDRVDPEGPGHVMKMRYAPQQVRVLAVEEHASAHRAAMTHADSLDGVPVVWVPLHSMLAPAVAGARIAGAERVVYVMTDGAALPAAFSRQTAALRASGLLHGTVTTGQAFGGDLEAVTTFSGLLAARLVARADAIVLGDGPGKVGTETRWGASDVESALSLHAAAILAATPVVALRVSFDDPQERHRIVSTHSLTVLSKVAPAGSVVAVPSIEDDGRRSAVWGALTAIDAETRHQLVEANGRPAIDALREHAIPLSSMGRPYEVDPVFFEAAGAAGVLAGRMAERDRAWGDQDRSAGRQSAPSRES